MTKASLHRFTFIKGNRDKLLREQRELEVVSDKMQKVLLEAQPLVNQYNIKEDWESDREEFKHAVTALNTVVNWIIERDYHIVALQEAFTTDKQNEWNIP